MIEEKREKRGENPENIPRISRKLCKMEEKKTAGFAKEAGM